MVCPVSSQTHDHSGKNDTFFSEQGKFRIKIFGLFFLLRCFVVVVCGRVSSCSLGWPRIHHVDQAGLKLIDLPVSASQMLVLKVCSTTLAQFCSPPPLREELTL